MKQRLSEDQFLRILEKKSLEEQRILSTEVMPEWARGFGEWLVVNPWRILVPSACLIYLGVRFMFGIDFREWILGLFGGFA